ncbi:MAG: SH3 domain-containing protein [Phaeodactylibacter sp.]|nr:SH3 domain-containing protein [Phaeodactylibacter sp.]
MLKNPTFSILFFSFWLLPFHSPAQPAQALEAANQAYQDKEYAEAIRQYEEILLDGYYSEALYYNLGNAYYRNGELGRAILNYHRALNLAPKDEDILHNLELARSRLPDEIVKIQQSGVVKAWLSIQNTFSTRSWSFMGLALFWLGCAGFAIRLLGKNQSRKKAALGIGVILIVLSVFPFLLAFGRSQQEFFSDKAVIMVEETTLHAAPEENSQEVQKLYEGSTVEILDAIGAWNKVRLEDTKEGWLPKDVMEKV